MTSEQGEGICKTVHYRGLTQKEFDEKHKKSDKTKVSLWNRMRQKSRPKLSLGCLGGVLELFLPIISVVRTYRFREYILGDIVAGISVGVMTIPQSMGYAYMASVPPIMGLYTSFFPVLLFCIFTSTRHVTVGTMALASLIHSSTIQRATFDLQEQIINNPNDTALSAEFTQKTVAIAVSVTFMSGIILVILSALQLSFFVTYIGEALIAGFLTGSNIRVITQQLKLVFNIAPLSKPGLFEYVHLVINMCKLLPQANIACIVISVVSIALLLSVKYFINMRFKSKLKVPIPIDFILLVIATLFSYFLKFDERFGVRTVAFIPKGVPSPSLPKAQYMSDYFLDSIVLALINYLMIYVIAVLFADRHNLSVRPNQEMFATGIANIFSALFSGIGSSISPPRSFIMEATGGKTQVAYLVSAFIILLCMLLVAPLLEALPLCVLASIIIVACIPLFEQYRKGFMYWKTCTYDFAIWLVTSVAVLFTTIELGLMIGIAFSFVVVVFRTQRSFTTILVEAEDGTYLPERSFPNDSSESSSVRIFRFEGPLFFATVGRFKQQLFKYTISPSLLKREASTTESDILLNDIVVEVKSPANDNTAPDTNANTPLTARKSDLPSMDVGVKRLSVIVVDCGAIPFIDTSASCVLAGLVKEYAHFDIKFILASVNEDVKRVISRVPAWTDLQDEVLYPSVGDAMVAAHKMK